MSKKLIYLVSLVLVLSMAGKGWPADDPVPADGAILEDTWASLSWTPGATAASHDVYFGTRRADVAAGTGDAFRGNQTSTMFIVGFPGFPYPEGLVPGTTYYWRIDEVEADGTTNRGNVWSFWIPPYTAYGPDPADGAESVPLDVMLSWTPGFRAILHTVYFGDDFDTVSNATEGSIRGAATFTPPGPLEPGKIYYWRVDEYKPGVGTHKGDVWSFRTLPLPPPPPTSNLVAWWKLDEGSGNIAFDSSGNGHDGAIQGTPTWIDSMIGYGTALYLNGSNPANGYVDLGTWNPSEGTGQLTVALWVRWDGPVAGVWQGVIAKKDGGGSQGTQMMWEIFIHKDKHFIRFSRIGSYPDCGDRVLPIGQWSHVAVTFDGTTMIFYVDGEETGRDVFSPGSKTNSTIVIGANNKNGGGGFNGAVDDIRLYNNALNLAEIWEIMEGDPFAAWNPNPPNGAVDVPHKPILTWLPGLDPASFEIYFGTNADAVADATKTSPEYKGNKALGEESYDPGMLGLQTTYYWRVDEIDNTNPDSPWKGNVWSFTTGDFFVVDDFEGYNDIDRIFDKWIDGFGITTNGAFVGYDSPPYVEQIIVHSGKQSMPIVYNNTSFASYSEVKVRFEPPQDWTEEGVTEFSLWFRGDPSNAAEPFYVAITNSDAPVVVYHENPSAAQIATWTEWTIGLDEFIILADEFLTDVDSLAIGLGTKGGSATGATGKMFIDDLRLKR